MSVSSAVVGGATALGSAVVASCMSTRSSSSCSGAGSGTVSGAGAGWRRAVGAGIVAISGYGVSQDGGRTRRKTFVRVWEKCCRGYHRSVLGCLTVFSLRAPRFCGGVRNSVEKSGTHRQDPALSIGWIPCLTDASLQSAGIHDGKPFMRAAFPRFRTSLS
jgi:hypothetical protein